MQITTRGALFLSAVALVVLKLAGVLTWPWLVILVPMLIVFAPQIFGIAMLIGGVAVTVLVGAGVLIFGACAVVAEHFQERKWRAQRTAALKAGAAEGPWDRNV